jgi:hypothetical protein
LISHDILAISNSRGAARHEFLNNRDFREKYAPLKTLSARSRKE